MISVCLCLSLIHPAQSSVLFLCFAEFIADDLRPAHQSLQLLYAHRAWAPAEAAVGIEVELLGWHILQHPADARRHVLGCLRVKALHVDHAGAQLAAIVPLLPELDLGQLAAGELQHELIGARLQDAGEVVS